MSSNGKTEREVPNTRLAVISSITGILACLCDLVFTRLLAMQYPGYKPLLQPMSDLGDAGSPVAGLASTWWIVMGLMFIIFAYGFYRTLHHLGKPAQAAGWMIAVYGIGEGLGSALVPGSPGHAFRTTNSIVHNILGGFGVLAIILIPFFIMKICRARHWTLLYGYSWFTTVSGISFFVLFSISFFYHPAGSWISYNGLWQRLFMLVYYLYLICLAALMLTRKKL